MKKFLNCTNHTLTEDQIKDIKNLEMEIVELPVNLKKAWGSMNPSNWIRTYIKTRNYITSNEINMVLIAGYTPAVVAMANSMFLRNITAVYSHTDRSSVEKMDENGNVIKTSIFKHGGFYNIFDGDRITK